MALSKHAQPGPEEDGLPLDLLDLKRAALVLRVLNHEGRLQMLKLLHRKGPVTVTELYRRLRLEQSVASNHLALLRRARLGLVARQGRRVFYSVNYGRVNEVKALARRLTGILSP